MIYLFIIKVRFITVSKHLIKGVRGFSGLRQIEQNTITNDKENDNLIVRYIINKNEYKNTKKSSVKSRNMQL